jgi:hypothetical protein
MCDEPHSDAWSLPGYCQSASAFLTFVSTKLSSCSADQALSLMQSIAPPVSASAPYLYATLQAAAYFSHFFVVVDEDRMDVRASTYARQLSVALTAMLAPADDAARGRINKYIDALVLLRADGVQDDDIVRELFLRGGIATVSASGHQHRA